MGATGVMGAKVTPGFRWQKENVWTVWCGVLYPPPAMEIDSKYALMPVERAGTSEPRPLDPNGSPFKVVVDPVMRASLKKALQALIDHHDETLAAYITEGKLSLESYKEYVELFARSLRETMDNREGVHYLLRAAGLEGIAAQDVNLTPEWRWR